MGAEEEKTAASSMRATAACAALLKFCPDSGAFARADAIEADLDLITAHSPAARQGVTVVEAGDHARLYADRLLDVAVAAQARPVKSIVQNLYFHVMKPFITF